MQKTILNKKIRELMNRQEKIHTAWKKIGNKDLLEFFVELIPKALNAERCSIFILDPENDNVWLCCGTGLKERQVNVHTSGSMVGQVIRSGKFNIEKNMKDQAGAHDYVDMQTGFETRNAICVPVHSTSSGKVTGAIQVLNKLDVYGFSDEDKELLDKLAVQIQTSIDNMYLKQDWIRIFETMSQLINELENRVKALES